MSTAKVTGTKWYGGTTVTVECPHANSMGVLETEDCQADVECELNGTEWTIPVQCENCGNLLGGDVNVRARIEAECAAVVDNYDPTPWCGGCGSMTRSGCDCGPIAEND